jgi:CelD/BcsL family acetyltransferase involved in cellulose biosynthesis
VIEAGHVAKKHQCSERAAIRFGQVNDQRQTSCVWRLARRLRVSGDMIQKLCPFPTPAHANGICVAPSPVPQPDLPALQMRVRLVHDWQDLQARVADWRRLAELAVEPNVFYEPPVLLPALQHLADESIAVLLVEAPLRVRADDRMLLCGLFPLSRKRTLRGIPLSCLEMWRHDYCFLTTPLIRRDVAGATLQAFLQWQQQQSYRLMHLPLFGGGGELDQLFSEWLDRLGMCRTIRDRHPRAAVVRRQSVDEVLGTALSRKRRHELRRSRRKLEEQGTLQVHSWQPPQDPGPWIAQFLAMEAAGWKGRAGSDMARRPGHREFFEQMIRQSAASGQLMMLRLQLDQHTVAMKINLLARETGFCFKIVYDETYARYSPGVLLELENLAWLHDRNHDMVWMDSCALPGHSMIESLWPDRRTVESVVIPATGRWAGLAAASIPVCRALKHAVRHGQTRPAKPS